MILEINNLNMPLNYSFTQLINKCKTKLKTNNIKNIYKLKESVDARNKNTVHYVLNVGVEVDNKYKNKFKYKIIEVDYDGLSYKKISYTKSPVIVGFGPSGIFAGLALSKMGLNPIIVEQGKDVDSRKEDVNNFWNNRKLNKNSNVQYGEGGAGTFSDGKLNTNINDKYNRKVINEFIMAGAPKEIYYNSKPHIGSDNLPTVVKNIRETIIKNGGKILFNHKFVNFSTKNNKINKVFIKNLQTNDIIEIETDNLILAIGHSAFETFKVLYDNNVNLQPKPFAIGVRIEQNQSLINFSQYGESAKYLKSADYKLVTHLNNGRSVFTFCMCPGGQVVASNCEENSIVTNGMSNFARNLSNSNSAILVNVKPDDFMNGNVLDGFTFQRKYEKLAFELGGSNYNAPCQKVKDFLSCNKSKNCTKFSIKIKKLDKNIKKYKKNAKKTLFLQKNDIFFQNNQNIINPSYKPNVTFCDISKCLPDFVTESLKQALPIFNSKIKHFADDNCILTAIETRTSCPVQIVRNESGQSNIEGLYPIGEGAGYAGGIMTSALDGIYCAEKIYNKLQS